ncbi:MAG: UDP-4-amino-4,6-dideoxy-N-acetyl-beta-L-altrosamine transaminase [Pseudomonadota bacterium]
MAFIPYGRQDVTQADIDQVVAVLKSDFLTQGPMIPRFEEKVAAYCGASHAVAVNSATSALHIACLALGVGEGDWLWTSPITFVASANCGLYCGASIDFVDISPASYNICPEALSRKLQEAEKLGRLPKVVVAVHLTGQSCDMESIHQLSRKYGFYVIEDASHAVGGSYRDDKVGCGKFSDITVFSFHPVKIITSAEGGMALTNNSELASRMELFRSHGITRNPEVFNREPDGPWYYEQVDLGLNYRLTDIQAALGLSQMERLDAYVEKRHALAARYDRLLAELPITCPMQSQECYSGFHLYVIRLQLANSAVSHRELFERLRECNIGVNLHYIPVYRQPYFARMGFTPSDYPQAEAYYREAISIPMYATLEEQQQDQVVAALRDILT